LCERLQVVHLLGEHVQVNGEWFQFLNPLLHLLQPHVDLLAKGLVGIEGLLSSSVGRLSLAENIDKLLPLLLELFDGLCARALVSDILLVDETLSVLDHLVKVRLHLILLPD